MDELPENLPPELREIGKRVRDERPAADNHTLDRVMTRAQAARQERKDSVLWRSSAPRRTRKSIVAAFAALVLSAGMASSVAAWSFPSIGGFNLNLSSIANIFSLGQDDPPASDAQYPPACNQSTIYVFAGIGDLLAIELAVDSEVDGPFEIQQVIDIGFGPLRVIVCINIGDDDDDNNTATSSAKTASPPARTVTQKPARTVTQKPARTGTQKPARVKRQRAARVQQKPAARVRQTRSRRAVR